MSSADIQKELEEDDDKSEIVKDEGLKQLTAQQLEERMIKTRFDGKEDF